MLEAGSQVLSSALLQVLHRRVAVSRKEERGDWELIGESIVPQRVYTLQEVKLLADAAGFCVEGLFGEMSLAVSLEDEEAYRMVVVLSKQADSL